MAEQPKKKVTIVTKKKTSDEKAGAPAAAPAPKKKEKGGLLDLQRLLDFPAGLAEGAREVWMAGIGALSSVEEAGSDLFAQLVRKGEAWERESRKRLAEAQQSVSAAVGGARQTAEDLAEMPAELSGRLEAGVRGALEESIEGVLHRLNVPTREEVRELTRRVERLAGKVDALQERLRAERAAREAAAAAAGAAERTVVRVVPQEEGWAVERDGAAASTHGTKAEALRAGRSLARGQEPSLLVVLKQDGTEQDTIAYGE